MHWLWWSIEQWGRQLLWSISPCVRISVGLPRPSTFSHLFFYICLSIISVYSIYLFTYISTLVHVLFVHVSVFFFVSLSNKLMYLVQACFSRCLSRWHWQINAFVEFCDSSSLEHAEPMMCSHYSARVRLNFLFIAPCSKHSVERT